jgi:hypothetical protein
MVGGQCKFNPLLTACHFDLFGLGEKNEIKWVRLSLGVAFMLLNFGLKP